MRARSRSPIAWHCRSNATRSAPTNDDSTTSAPDGQHGLDDGGEVAGAERRERLADDAAALLVDDPARRRVHGARPHVVVAREEPAPPARRPHDGPGRGAQLLAGPLAQPHPELAALPALVHHRVHEQHPVAAQRVRHPGVGGRGGARHDRPAAALHEPPRLGGAPLRVVPSSPTTSRSGAPADAAVGVDLVDGHRGEVRGGGGEDAAGAGLAGQQAEEVVAPVGGLAHGVPAAAHEPAQAVLVEVGDDPHARAAALGVEEEAQRAPPGHVEVDLDPARGAGARDPAQQLDGRAAQRRPQRHRRTRGQPVAHGVEQPARARTRPDQVEHSARRRLDPLLDREGEARHHMARASGASASAAALASAREPWNSSCRKRMTSCAGPVASTE